MVAFVSVDLDASGGGTATVDDDRRPITAEDLPSARTAAMNMLAQVARQRAGVRARVSDPEGAYMLELDRTGAVRSTGPARPSRAARPRPAPTTARQTSSDVATPPNRAERADEDYDLTDVDDAPPVEPDDDPPPGARSVVELTPLPRPAEDVPVWEPLAPAEPDERDDESQEQLSEAGTAATVTLDDAGGGDVVIGERTVPLAHGTLNAARRAAIDLLADVAADAGHAVRALVDEPAGRFLVDVDQDRDVTPVREGAAPAPERRGRWRLRARTAMTLAAAAVFAAVMLWPAPTDRSPHRAPAAAAAAASEQARADQREREWIAARQGAARTAASAQVLEGHRSAARAVLDAARATLDGTPQAEDAVRAHLSALVDQAEADLNAGASLATWRDLVRVEIPAAEQSVRDSQTAWQAAEDDRIANTPAPAASSGGTQGAATPSGGSGSSAAEPSAPRGQQAAPPAAPGGGGGSSWTHVEANPLSTTSGEVGIARVRITVSGTETVTVVLTIGGTSVTVGTVAGAGTLTGEISGLPAGSHAWNVTSGSATATGPPIRVF